MNREAVVEALKEIRDRAGWSDAELARQVGVSRVTWYYILIGRQRPGATFLERAVARFPELRDLLFLPADVTEGDDHGHAQRRTRDHAA